jgi:hypothetical protein
MKIKCCEYGSWSPTGVYTVGKTLIDSSLPSLANCEFAKLTSTLIVGGLAPSTTTVGCLLGTPLAGKARVENGLSIAFMDLTPNGRAHIRHQCRKTAVLS